MTQTDQQNVPKLRFPGFEDRWTIQPIGELGRVIRGASPRPKGDKRYYGGNVPRLMVEDVTRDGKYVTPKTDFLTEAGAKLSRPCNAGTLTIVCSGTVGVPSILAVDACIHDGFLALVDLSEEINIDFLYASLLRLKEKFDASATHGGVFVNLTTSILKEFQATLPTLPEQCKIAGFLGALDTKIAQLTEKKRLLEDYKKGCMQQLFSQAIRFKDDNGHDFPAWEEKRLGDVFSWVNTNSLSRDRLTSEGGQVQNIHYGDIHTKFAANFHQGAEPVPFVKDATIADFKPEHFCQVGDVVIADASEDYADIGKAIEIVSISDIPLVAGLHTYIARPKPSTVQTGFAGYLLRSEPTRRQIERIAQGISVLGISKGNLEKLTLFLPHTDEQRKIADFLSALDAKIDLVARELTQAQAFKKGMLQQMFV